MLGRPQEYTGPWGKEKRTSWTEEVKDPYWTGMRSDIKGPTRLRPGVRYESGKFLQNRSGMQMTEDLPWYMQGEGGGMLGRRRSEVEGINPQEIYGLSAPSVRKTTEGLISSFEEDAARRNLSPAMAAMMKRSALGSELEGLGSAAGQSAVGAFGMKERARSGLATMEANLGAGEMAGRRGVTRSRLPLKMQTRGFQREDTKQRESQNRLKQFWANYGM